MPKRVFTYNELRVKMQSEKMTASDVGYAIGKSRDYVADRLCGRVAWSLADAYMICRALSIPLDQIADFWNQKEVIKHV